MIKFLVTLSILMTISFNANAGFLLGYTMGRGSCSCSSEKNEIEKLKKENNKLKEEINNLIRLLEKKTATVKLHENVDLIKVGVE